MVASGFELFLMPSARSTSNLVHDPALDLKDRVGGFWNADPCGTRYMGRAEDFAAHARARYLLEPHIPEFAGFATARGLRVLEIGVGTGADYLEWLKVGARATGVDLSAASIEKARRRCALAGYSPDLQVADAERLQFPDESFDIVYSYGVMHHSPDTSKCVREAWRILKPGGEARIMIYHHPSLTGAMLWLRYGLWRGKTLRGTICEYLESPATKTYTKAEVHAIMEGFEEVIVRQVFSPGDLLLNKPSARFQSQLYRLVWDLYPRILARRFCKTWGLFLLISGRKPPIAKQPPR